MSNGANSIAWCSICRPAPATRNSRSRSASRWPAGSIVTTPQEVALIDVRRGVTMFQEVNVPVLGVIENMSYYICRKCGTRHEIFAHGGGARLAHDLGVPFLGELPMVRELREGGDNARPLVAVRPDHPIAAEFRSIADRVIDGLERTEA